MSYKSTLPTIPIKSSSIGAVEPNPGSKNNQTNTPSDVAQSCMAIIEEGRKGNLSLAQVALQLVKQLLNNKSGVEAFGSYLVQLTQINHKCSMAAVQGAVTREAFVTVIPKQMGEVSKKDHKHSSHHCQTKPQLLTSKSRQAPNKESTSSMAHQKTRKQPNFPTSLSMLG